MSKKKLYPYLRDSGPIPPGLTIAETAEFYGVTQQELANRVGYDVSKIEGVMLGNIPITEEIAACLARVLGMDKDFLLRLELNYQKQKADQVNSEKLKLGLPVLKTAAVKELKKRKIIQAGAPLEEIDAVLRFYKAVTVDSLNKLQHNPTSASLRHKRDHQSDRLSLIAWLRLCELKAEKMEIRPYSEEKLCTALSALRSLTVALPKEFLPEMIRICAEVGVAVVCVPEFPSAYVKGAAKWLHKDKAVWLTQDKAMIALNLHENFNDIFWFTFFHEVSHILSGRKRFLSNYSEILSNLTRLDEQEEKRANKFAERLLIPPKHNRKLKKLTLEEDILAFAAEIGIAPGIVVGRLQHEKIIGNNEFNCLKQTFRWREK